MRVLVHLCCGPCGITVLQWLLGAGHEPHSLFFNPNIQPLSEYMRRREGASQVAERLGVPFIPQEVFLPAEDQNRDDPWLPLSDDRCLSCWRIRLRKTAQLAKACGCDGFTSSLLYSRHQDHAAIRELGEAAAEETGLVFVYEDFRTSWQEGVRLSKEWGIYRQKYCGCSFSECDRYSRGSA